MGKGGGLSRGLLHGCGGGNHGVYYIGDHRDFSPFSRSFRAHSEVIVSAASGSAITSPVFLAGTTTRYSDDALAPDGYTLVGDANYNDCHLTDKVVPGIIAANVLVQSGGFGVVSAELYGDATNMATTYPQLTPSITWDFNYTINAASNPTFPAWTLQYTHDCYPAHEVYIGAQLIYGFKPTSNSPANVGLCLAGVNPVSGSSIGTVN